MGGKGATWKNVVAMQKKGKGKNNKKDGREDERREKRGKEKGAGGGATPDWQKIGDHPKKGRAPPHKREKKAGREKKRVVEW